MNFWNVCQVDDNEQPSGLSRSIAHVQTLVHDRSERADKNTRESERYPIANVHCTRRRPAVKVECVARGGNGRASYLRDREAK